VTRTACLLLAVCVFAPSAPAIAEAATPPPEPVARKAGNPEAPPTICDGSTALTLIGIDTSSGHMLFSVPPLGPKDHPWIVDLDATGSTARAHSDPPKGLYSGSVGPGPVVAAVPCGKDCVQPMRWENEAWSPLGEPLTTPSAANLSTTYDR